MHYTLAALILATTVRLFHDETVTSLAVSRHTHVRVTGRVTLVKKEADGGIHFRLADDEGHFIVCEIVPYHPLQAPKLGQMVTVEGIHRYDNEVGHGFHELHPVEQWYPAREKGDGSQGHQVHAPSPHRSVTSIHHPLSISGFPVSRFQGSP